MVTIPWYYKNKSGLPDCAPYKNPGSDQSPLIEAQISSHYGQHRDHHIPRWERLAVYNHD